MSKMMFLYESLHDHQKDMIDEEIESYIKSMIIKNRGFNYTDQQFHDLMYKIIVHGKYVNRFIGEAINCFNIKEIVVKARAIKIAYELEQNRPSRDLIEFYIQLCKELNIEPTTEVLFDNRFALHLVHSYSSYKSRKNKGLENSNNGEEKDVDIQHQNSYSKSSNIIYFEELFEDFYSADSAKEPCPSH